MMPCQVQATYKITYTVVYLQICLECVCVCVCVVVRLMDQNQMLTTRCLLNLYTHTLTHFEYVIDKLDAQIDPKTFCIYINGAHT